MVGDSDDTESGILELGVAALICLTIELAGVMEGAVHLDYEPAIR